MQAVEGFLSCVNPLMGVGMALTDESFITVGTLEEFLSYARFVMSL